MRASLFVLFCMMAYPSSAPVFRQWHGPIQTLHDCVDCPEMVIIPGGHFDMGAPAKEKGRYPEEGPVHQVNIQSFAAGKFDITRGQWAAFVTATNRPIALGCAYSFLSKKEESQASWKKLGFPQDDTHPAVCLNWTDVVDYLKWISKKTGRTYRLLTESEWEYAARAGTQTAFPWGDSASHEFANYGADTGHASLALGRDRWIGTSPVGAFPPNAFGLYDMNGNVLQFVADCFSGSYRHTPIDGSDYRQVVMVNDSGNLSGMNGKNSCAFRMVRGGDFGDPPEQIRSAFRNWAPGEGTLESYRSSGLGFRVARDVTDK